MKKLRLFEVKEKAEQLLACQEIEDLERLGFDANEIHLLAMSPPYYRFETRKSDGSMREIEAPEHHLKMVQKHLNAYLQCVYFLLQSDAAYGYIIRVKDVHPPKNILENARRHLGASYMLNVDFEDFFHQIKFKPIRNIFQSPPFQFEKKEAHILTNLCTRNGRLPMGAPTSPVISNLATIELDHALTAWAKENNVVYTRFVDDLTFSSKEKASDSILLEQIQSICEAYHLALNPHKTKIYDAEDIKKVTGLVLRDTIDIEPGFYTELDKDLRRLRKIAEVNVIMDKHNHNDLLRDFKKEIDGKINFIGMIEGYTSQLFRDYRHRLKQALNPDEDILSTRWLYAHYF